MIHGRNWAFSSEISPEFFLTGGYLNSMTELRRHLDPLIPDHLKCENVGEVEFAVLETVELCFPGSDAIQP